MRVYRWDLDKTYLQTDFDSFRGLVRSAIEPARAKRAVPGATALIRELGREGPGWRPRIAIVSGSPTQMRNVIENKLRIDGVRWDTLTLKDNLGNLRRGRLRAMREQFGYKLPELVEGRVGLGPAVRETCFGDDAEADALVYSVYAEAVAGRLDATEVSRVMSASRAYGDDVARTLSALRRVSVGDAVDRIFIRLDRNAPVSLFEPLGTRVVPVRSWFQAALVLYGSGELEAEGLDRVLGTCSIPTGGLAPYVEEILERGAVAADALHSLFHDRRDTPAWSPALPLLDRAWTPRPPSPPSAVDWVRLVHDFAAARRRPK